MRFSLIIEAIKIAAKSLRAHKLRTLLTMLGVAIGIFSITIIFTLVNSLNYNINKNLKKLGNSMIFVHHIPWSSEAMNNWQKYYKRPKASFEEYLRLKKHLRYVDGVAYEVRLNSQKVKTQKSDIQGIRVNAITEDYIPMNNFEFESGRPFSALESDAGRPVCVVGHNVVEKLFEGRNPVGEKITWNGKKIKVIGVIAKSGGSMFGSSPDDMIYTPYKFAARIFDMNSRRLDKYILVKAVNPEKLEWVEDEITGMMRQERRLKPGAENNFDINRPEMIISMFENALKYLWIGGIFISLFSVLVGGFGIGNIMYTTIKERTFEIGLQKAMGARKSFILFQFMMESVLLCLLGGVIGLLLNAGLSWLLSALSTNMDLGFEIIVSGSSILTGVLMSLLIGLTSGIIPSMAAANMDPVESMRA